MAKPPVPIPGATAKAADQAARQHNALWYTFAGIGRAYLIQRGSFDAGAADVAGVHGYATIEQAYANPNTVDAASQVTIQQWNNHASLPAGGGTFGTVETVNITAPAKPGAAPVVSTPQNPATAAASQDIPGLPAIGDFFSRLTEAATWIRIAKVVAGGVLLIVGLVHITGADNSVANVARKVPLPV